MNSCINARCFNGAATVQPRKGRCLGWATGTHGTASMGPRLFSRGKLPTNRAFTVVFPSFNGAATVQPRKAI